MNVSDLSPIGIIIALLGVGGLGAFLRDLITAIGKWAGGMSVRTEKRKLDIVQERDRAVEERDSEAKKRRILEEAYAELRRVMISDHQIPQAKLPTWPEYGQTLTPEEVARARRGEAP